MFFAAGSGSAQTSVSITNGLKWLNLQVQADGHLKSEATSIATPLQAGSEAAQTLQLLASSPGALNSLIVSDQDASTEYLARRIIAQAAVQGDVSVLVAALSARINADGGFASAPGYSSSVLDTSLALLALKRTGRTDGVANAIAYLQAAQQTDGSFQLMGRTDIYSSVYALAAYRAHASSFALSTSIQSSVNFLLSQQSSPGTWNNSVFLSALAYENLHDFIPAAPMASALQNYILSTQMPDGSWGGDPYQTAVALRALSASQLSPTNPGLGIIKGQLLESQTGLPVAGVKVTLSGAATAELTTGADGTFVFNNQTPGNYTINFTLANYAPLSTNTVLKAGQTLDLGVLKLIKAGNSTTATIYGVVTNASTGSPIAGATISGASFSVNTDAKGAYQIANVPVGDIVVTVSYAGLQTMTITLHTSAGATLTFSPALSAPSSIKGQVVDSQSGAPLVGVHVVLSGNASVDVITGVDGSFVFGQQSQGSYSVTIAPPNYGTLTATLTLAGGQTMDLGVLKLTKAGNAATGSISGVVVNAASGTPIAGATVSGPGFSTATDASGAYQISSVAPGDIQLTVSKTGFKPVTNPVRISAGSNFVFSPSLSVETSVVTSSTVTGLVLDAGTNAPLSGVAIIATDSAGPHTTTSDAQGKFTFSNLVKDKNGGVGLTFSIAQYVDSSNYVSIDGIALVDMGQVRLRKVKAVKLLPDVVVTNVSRVTAITDPQSLKLSGQVSVSLQNQGAVDIPAGMKLLAFQDTNKNGIYDAGIDQQLGSIVFAETLAVNEIKTVQFQVQGTMPFRDAPISVWADSDQVLIETNKANNVGSTASAAAIKPNPDLFQPKIKWEWKGSPVMPEYTEVMNTPIVLPIQDTNGDGKYDQRDIPGVVFNSFKGVSFGDGVLRAVSGKDGSDLWTVSDSTLRTMPHSSLAGADLDGNGKVSIVAVREGGGLMAIDNTGKLKWLSPDRTMGGDWLFWGGPSIADLDHDGKPEIVLGNMVFNSDGSTRWKGDGYKGISSGGYTFGALSIVADINLDGNPVVLAGAQAYRGSDGATIWKNTTVGDGLDAVGNFTGDKYPQIAVVGNGKLSLLDHNGNIIWGPVNIPGGWQGGAPIVADIDGDGIPEIGVASASRYTVFRADGSILWSNVVQDLTSSATSSSAFDFAGNGQAQVVYGDEVALRVFRGVDGKSLFETPNSSGTAFEEPVIVDVDGDGHADILIAANQWTFPNGPGIFHGLRAFSDVNNSWVAVRKIWNQHSYHITNINDDGSVPRFEKNSWDVSNTYRLNARVGAPATAVPDITASYIRVNDQGATKPSTFTVRIGNAGLLPILAGTKVAYYSGQAGTGGTLLGTALTSVDLNVNEYQDVSFSFTGSVANIKTLVVVADDDGAGAHSFEDFDPTNNSVSLNLANLPGKFGITVMSDQPSFPSNSNVQVSSVVSNLGSLDNNAQIQFSIQTTDGINVASLPAQTIKVVAGAQTNVNAVWNTGTTLSGKYQLVAQILDANGQPYVQATTALNIVSPGTVLSAKVIVDKISYSPSDTVQLSDTINNLAQNLPVDNIRVVTTVTNPDGTVRFSKAETLAQLPSANSKNYAYSIPLAGAPAGQYAVMVVATAGSTTVQSTTSFAVTSSASNGNGLTGTVTVTPSKVQAGSTLALNFSVNNQGNSALTNQALSVNIIDPVGQKVIAQFPYTTNLDKGGIFTGSTSWVASAGSDTTYVATLTASFGANTVTLAQTNISVTAPQYKLGAVIDNDKASYAPTDTVKLHDKISNLSASLAAANLQVQVTVKNPDGSTRFTKMETLTSLAANAAQDYNYSISLSAVPAGQYTTSVVVSGAGNTVLAQASGGFLVASTATTGSGLKGSITASASQVPVGNTVSFPFTVSNQGNADLPNLPLTVFIANATQKVTITYPYSTNLGMNAQFTGTADWVTTGNAGEVYTVTLSAKVGSNTLTLSQTTFTLTSSVVSLSIKQAATPWQNVLVYSACKRAADELLGKCAATKFPTENAATLAQCDASRAGVLDNVLANQGISHTISTDATAFLTQLRSGNYSTYWISNGASALPEPAASELLAAVKRGQGFVLDSLVTATNTQLAQCSGVTNNGAYATALQQMSLSGGIYKGGDLAGPATQTKLATAGGTVEATLKGTATSPGIVSATYGNGKTLAFGFDWSDTLAAQANESRWPLMIKQGLDYLAPAAVDLNALLPGDVSTLSSTITNAGAAQPVRIVQSLPAGSVIKSSTPAATIGSNGNGDVTATWNLTAASAADTVVSVRWQAPVSAGTYNANLALSMVSGGNATPYKSQDQAIKVQSASQINAQTISLIQGLSLSTPAQLAQRTAIVDLLNQVNTAMSSNSMDKALRLLITVQAKLKNIETGVGPASKSLANLIAVVERQVAR
ncbi:carboxypeptidase regulatory-like domain-containing protein [Undibacterium sp. TC4M20W]|uniref:carboxypeptidase regulatory-like domain-containing protein n=1 Tax=Undibacterium sp. TC4M20W TaxID=3413052 RepID=UPI003BF0F780